MIFPPPRPRLRADAVIGLALLAFSVWVYWQSGTFRKSVSTEIGPRFFPQWLVAILGVFSLGLVARTWFYGGTPPEEETAGGEGGFAAVAAAIAPLAVYILAMNWLGHWLSGAAAFEAPGYWISTPLYLAGSAWWLGERRALTLVGFPACVTVLIYLVFQSFLNVPLP